MNFFQFSLLGLLQGITEFIPVSSSGHLVLVGYLWEIGEKSLLFNTVLHFATLLAILLFLGTKEINCPIKRLFLLVVGGSIPTVVLGLAFKPFVEEVFISPVPVGMALLATGFILMAGDRVRNQQKDMNTMTLRDALFIGMAQGFAVLPGISRSGITIITGMMCGLKREVAAEFSFILVIPAVIGAMGLELWEWRGKAGMAMPLLLLWGGFVALIAGYISLVILFKVLKQRRLRFFAYYCWIAGAGAILFSVTR